ncbi:hypothetical protein [Anaerobacillus sp. 1_MG-2023]|uniref:hypothetical protein n=1 Tax=Anaerobacillus sp. 1_MG-2023 TaxID=3062655 RepID=UPI0026E23C1F|nr:hypothetical protein [Anaerobacillus sp. 1_MG-2023]MDO6657828.1 hypothetical protein [Anaerobacillus sp. 1_MG-2023]
MEKGVYARYNQNVYSVSKNDLNYIRMVSKNKSDLNNGFVEKTYPNNIKDIKNLPEIYIKEVKRSEVEQLFKLDYKAKYNGHIFNVVFPKDQTKVKLGTTDAELAKENDFERTDKYYYEKLVDVQDVKLIELKQEL